MHCIALHCIEVGKIMDREWSLCDDVDPRSYKIRDRYQLATYVTLRKIEVQMLLFVE